ncbi:MAG: pyruvate formate lyase-activating protein [Clostridia bacterium]|nr:pyruvate formate lyase-activating protein [Clostridia bacterium]
MEGYIHSVESFGTVDGPGIRFVVFFSGCPLRCKYCHNPDTWDMSRGTKMSADELIEQYLRNKAFYNSGGITVTGGEPLMQIDFLTELFKLAKNHGIHTCIDTSGATYRGDDGYRGKLDTLMQYTDLVMLDIKHIDSDLHNALCGMGNEGVLEFAKYLDEKQIPTWIRHVVVSGITDDEEQLKKLGRFIATLKNVKALDVLPYHTMGVAKYKELGIEYPLKGLEPLTVDAAKAAKDIILDSIKANKQKATD